MTSLDAGCLFYMNPIFSRLEIEPLAGDTDRVTVYAEMSHDALAPSLGTVNVEVTLQIWVGDNPTLQQVEHRIMDTLSRAFELPIELRGRLGSVYERIKEPGLPRRIMSGIGATSLNRSR